MDIERYKRGHDGQTQDNKLHTLAQHPPLRMKCQNSTFKDSLFFSNKTLGCTFFII